jgi:cytochrome c
MDGQEYLAERIVKGSSGVWGPVPMPAHSSHSAEDARALAAWIASMAK